MVQVGDGVSELVLSCSRGLTSSHVRAFLRSCPNIRRWKHIAFHYIYFFKFKFYFFRLDLSHTNIDEHAFALTKEGNSQSENRSGDIPLRKIEELNLQGCR